MAFQKAKRKGIWVRSAIDGPSGSGKTWTSLVTAKALADKFDYKIAVIDTERGSASKYADYFDFDVLELDTYGVERYIGAMKEAEKEGYKVLVIDSLSHAWTGIDGILDRHDSATKRSKSGNSYNAWREVTPLHNQLIDAILNFNGHVIVTMRTKTEYIVEQTTNNGRSYSVPKKIGMAPIQRDGMEYEFDIVGDMDLEHNLVISKTRCHPLADKVFKCPGQNDNSFTDIICDWVGSDVPVVEKPLPQKPSGTYTEPLQDRVFKGVESLYKAGVDGVLEKVKECIGDKKVKDCTNEELQELWSWVQKTIVEKKVEISKQKPENVAEFIANIYEKEKIVYPLAMVVKNARTKYLDGKDPKELGRCEQTEKYFEHLVDKYKAEMKKKSA